VLHLLHSLEPGGTERVVCRLAAALAGGTRRHLLCGLRAPRPFGSTIGQDLTTYCLDLAPRDRLSFLKLAGLLRKLRPDIVHARNWGTWTVAALACRLVPGTRLLLGFHGLQSGSCFTPQQRRRARWLGLHRQEFTSVSQSGADLLSQDLGIPHRRITVIANGVDLDRFQPASPARKANARAELQLQSDVPVVGCVANFFEAIKGHDVLAPAFELLSRTHPQVHLLLVGYGPLESSVREDLARRGLSERVRFTGRREDVPDLLGACDLFACPSHAEGMSNAVLESLACGLPGVVTDVSDHRELFTAIDPTCVVPAGDVPALANQLRYLLENPDHRRRCASAARAVAERYSFAITVERYRMKYAQLLPQKSPLSADVASVNQLPVGAQ
jgi:glycosyltransferase involved in cell wall biosynthesis